MQIERCTMPSALITWLFDVWSWLNFIDFVDSFQIGKVFIYKKMKVSYMASLEKGKWEYFSFCVVNDSVFFIALVSNQAEVVDVSDLPLVYCNDYSISK